MSKLIQGITNPKIFGLFKERFQFLKNKGYEIIGIFKLLEMQSDLEKYAILVNLEDKFGEVKSIQFLIDTPKKYQHYSKVGRKRAERYSLSNTYKDFKKLLEPNIEE